MTKEYIRKLFLYEDDEDISEFIQKYFGENIIRSIEFMEKYNIFEEDDNVREWYLRNYPNAITLHLLNTNKTQAMELILNSLSDIKEEGGKLWMYIMGRDELAKFFDDSSSRYSTPKDMAEKVLQDDYHEYLNWDDSMSTKDLIDELNPENLKKLRDEFVKRNTGSSEFTLDDEEFEVTTENMDDITDDELSELVNQDFELKGRLQELYNHSAGYAYSDEVYKDVMGGLQEFFGTKDFLKDSSFSVTRTDGSVVYRNKWEVDVTNIFLDAVVLSLNQYLKYDDNVFGGSGDFETILLELIDEADFNGGYIDFRIPEYPDFSKTTQYMNDIFNDYI